MCAWVGVHLITSLLKVYVCGGQGGLSALPELKVPVNHPQSQWNCNGLSVAQYPMRFCYS